MPIGPVLEVGTELREKRTGQLWSVELLLEDGRLEIEGPYFQKRTVTPEEVAAEFEVYDGPVVPIASPDVQR